MQPTTENENNKIDNVGRGKPCPADPWCWCSKGALKMITAQFAESNQAISARSVYVAMTELASDAASDTFTASKALIAHKAGVSYKTVERILHGLEVLALIKIDRNETAGVFNAPNTYTLLPIRHSGASMRHDGKHASKSDKVEESGKIFKKSFQKDRARARLARRPAAPAPCVSATADFSELVRIVEQCIKDRDRDRLITTLQSRFPDTDVAHGLDNYLKPVEHGKRPTPRGFIGKLLGVEPTLKPTRHR